PLGEIFYPGLVAATAQRDDREAVLVSAVVHPQLSSGDQRGSVGETLEHVVGLLLSEYRDCAVSDASSSIKAEIRVVYAEIVFVSPKPGCDVALHLQLLEQAEEVWIVREE